jgi:multicomponent Na+:H+ antiporter subunit D
MLNLNPISSIYLIVFLPLILSLFCNIFKSNKINFIITFLSIFIPLLILIDNYQLILENKQVISNFETSVISTALEFKIDLVSINFLIFIYLAKILILFCHKKNHANHISNQDYCNKFYAVFIINIFAITGIILTNNLFNFFIFLELYALTFLGILTNINDKNIALISFRQFCINSVSSLFIVITIAILYLLFWELDIDKILLNVKIISKNNYLLFLQLSLIFTTVIIAKFFNFFNFYSAIKSKSKKDSINIIFFEVFSVNSLIGVYLIYKIFSIFLIDGLIIRNYNFNLIIMIFGLIITSLFLIKIFYRKNLKAIFLDFYLINLGCILICLSIYDTSALKAMFYMLLMISIVIPIMIKITSSIGYKIKSYSIHEIQSFLTFSNININNIILLVFVVNLILFCGFFANYFLFKSIIKTNYWILFLLCFGVLFPYYKILKIPFNFMFLKLKNLFKEPISKIKYNQVNFYILLAIISISMLTIYTVLFKRIDILATNFANAIQSNDYLINNKSVNNF